LLEITAGLINLDVKKGLACCYCYIIFSQKNSRSSKFSLFKEEKQESRRGHYSEIYYGAFSREYQFRETISEDKIKAAYQNGILELTIPKSAQSKPKQIEIK